jgi:signal transduction histidine kinase
MLTHFPDAGIQFESELPDGVCILTNKNYLMRILRVLLYNSAKYSDGKHIVLRVTQTETAVRFTVEDTGPGLPADLPDLMIKPFTKQPEETGWGLPLAKRLAVGLGGDLMIDTDYHEGCRMVIEMPK